MKSQKKTDSKKWATFRARDMPAEQWAAIRQGAATGQWAAIRQGAGGHRLAAGSDADFNHTAGESLNMKT